MENKISGNHVGEDRTLNEEEQINAEVHITMMARTGGAIGMVSKVGNHGARCVERSCLFGAIIGANCKSSGAASPGETGQFQIWFAQSNCWKSASDLLHDTGLWLHRPLQASGG